MGGVTSIGWWFLAIVLLGAARMVCRACAWVACVREGHLHVRDAFVAVLAGDTAGNLTPLGVLASEPTKILLTRGRLSTVVSIASVAIENAFYTGSVLVVLLSGTWVFLQRADVRAATDRNHSVIAIAMLVGVWAARTARRS